MRTRTAALALAALLAVTGCSAEAPLKSSVDVDNPELRDAKQSAGIAPCVPGDAEAPEDGLPDLTLPCLGGGDEVNLAGIEGPAVVSLWASWCQNCPKEQPLYQRLAEEAGDRLTVLGIDYEDTQPGAALELLRTAGVTFPQLADPGGDLDPHFGVRGLPGVILVDADGHAKIQFTLIDDYEQLADLVETHTGVRVRR